MKTKAPTESQMQKEVDRLNGKLWEIQKRRTEDKNSKLIGCCFKYRNHFSSPSDGWWLYAIVTGVDGNYCTSLDFQKKEDGSFEVRHNHSFINTEGWKKITRSEFDAEWSAFISELSGLHGADLPAKKKTKGSKP